MVPLQTISFCVAVLSLLFGAKMQLRYMVSFREKSTSIQSKPPLGISDGGCHRRSDRGSLWVCTKCTKILVTSIPQESPPDSLILDDLKSVLQLCSLAPHDFKALGRKASHENESLPKVLPGGIDSRPGALNVSNNSLCGNIAPAIRRFGLIGVLGNSPQGWFKNTTRRQSSLEENDIVDDEGADIPLELPTSDSFDLTNVLLLLVYVLVPVSGIIQLFFICFLCYEGWRHNNRTDGLPPDDDDELQLEQIDNGRRE